ncbi:MAG: hypothetical protein ACR2JR_07740 [Rubrobacteraceae bacterium]
MEPARADGGRHWKRLVWRVAAIIVVTLIVAALGAFVGWMLGSALTGIIFGAAIGFFGSLRSGYVMDEPNQERPG